MTIICYRAGVLAADSGAFGGDICTATVKKVFRLSNGAIVAFTGECADCYALALWVERGCEPKAFPARAHATGILVNRDGDLLRINKAGRTLPFVAEFDAVGCAEDFAKGALAAGASAEQAVELAIRHCAYVAGPVQIERL